MPGPCIVFFDCEVSSDVGKILDLGACATDGTSFHAADRLAFRRYMERADYICGHNVLEHDLKFAGEDVKDVPLMDTLYLSALLFPQKRFHKLLKNEKLRSDELNNPLSDAKKAAQLFSLELEAFRALETDVQAVFAGLLSDHPAYRGFFAYADVRAPQEAIAAVIRRHFCGRICSHADVHTLVQTLPLELAFALALIRVDDLHSAVPEWVRHRFPKVEDVMRVLRSTPCAPGCDWCRRMNVTEGLKRWFGFSEFRRYAGEPLQEAAASAAVAGRSLLAVFPTGGGKSLTFQLPALMAGESVRALTVVLSPLQSLMKDQVDHLRDAGIDAAVTVNGLLSPIERAESLTAVADGRASIIYLSPEQLRSRTIEHVLATRRIARFVIDEAHCFSAWGHDFRVDYLYIGDFIAKLQKATGGLPIPVSCFTATAKQKVIQDIRDYFHDKLGLSLELFTTQAQRENLRYTVLYCEDRAQKYAELRRLIELKASVPTIVYVSRTSSAQELAARLSEDGFPALAYHGKMDPETKILHQDAFLSDRVRIMVATNAFGMGVDKPDVGLVVHYDISSSLENYVQEAGRAGRDPKLEADCYVLFNEEDLDRHFSLLTQSKLSLADIQLVWRAVKAMTRGVGRISISAHDLAREAGWDTDAQDMETRLRTAVAVLEQAGYVRREHNAPRVYASGITVHTFMEGAERIDASPRFRTSEQRLNAKRILRALISSRRTRGARDSQAESRTDYLADRLGLELGEVLEAIGGLRDAGILSDQNDMTASLTRSDSQKRASSRLAEFVRLERFLIPRIARATPGEPLQLKVLNRQAQQAGCEASDLRSIRTLLAFLRTKGFIRQTRTAVPNAVCVEPLVSEAQITETATKRAALASIVLEELYDLAARQATTDQTNPEVCSVAFSTRGLQLAAQRRMFADAALSVRDIEEAVLYLSRIGAMRLDGGFLVTYNALTIVRLVADNKRQFKKSDYARLDAYYRQKVQQIHIVGKYANLMVKDYALALQYVRDYFHLEWRAFISRYFSGSESEEIRLKMTGRQYKRIFGDLSDIQRAVIDSRSQFIAVTAGPGSGKTRVLVHKLASLLLQEDVRAEQVLMLTFSRAAATEFKKRLCGLVGSVAHYVQIRTFHGYAFDVLGRPGTLEEAGDVVERAAVFIRSGAGESADLSKSVLVIDEAQDMDAHDFSLVEALIERNEAMRVIAVGDDDQNIYAFRGSDSKYFRSFIMRREAECFEMVENWRSGPRIVGLANAWVKSIGGRLKRTPTVSAGTREDAVELVRHRRTCLTEAVCEDVVRRSLRGTTAVLTGTNEEAFAVYAGLLRRGCRARLIQTRSEVTPANLLEVRALLTFLRRRSSGAAVDEALWRQAKDYLAHNFAESTTLAGVLRLVDLFESVTPEVRYLSDLEEFFAESRAEDMVDAERGTVLVSTVHKAKGREFDTVFLALATDTFKNDAVRRAVYVGLTRAKTALFVHWTGRGFRPFEVEGVVCREVTEELPPPTELTLPLGLEDVWLDWFLDKKTMLMRLRSGAALQPTERGELIASVDGVERVIVRLSRACLTRIEQLRASGFVWVGADIAFIVAWRRRDRDEEDAVVLPNLYFQRDCAGHLEGATPAAACPEEDS